MKSDQSIITINSPCFSNFETRYLGETSIIFRLVNGNNLITSDVFVKALSTNSHHITIILMFTNSSNIYC